MSKDIETKLLFRDVLARQYCSFVKKPNCLEHFMFCLKLSSWRLDASGKMLCCRISLIIQELCNHQKQSKHIHEFINKIYSEGNFKI